MHLHIYKTSSCWAVFFWPTAFFDFCMTSESYPYHLKVAASAFVCVLFFPSMFTSFIILPINHFNFESQTPEEWKKTMQVLDYQLFSVEKRTKISSVNFLSLEYDHPTGPRHNVFPNQLLARQSHRAGSPASRPSVRQVAVLSVPLVDLTYFCLSGWIPDVSAFLVNCDINKKKQLMLELPWLPHTSSSQLNSSISFRQEKHKYIIAVLDCVLCGK